MEIVRIASAMYNLELTFNTGEIKTFDFSKPILKESVRNCKT